MALLIFIPILSLNTSNKAALGFNFLTAELCSSPHRFSSFITLTIDCAARFLQNYIFLDQHTTRLLVDCRRNASSEHDPRFQRDRGLKTDACARFFDVSKIRWKTRKSQPRLSPKMLTSSFARFVLIRERTPAFERGMAVVTHEGIVGRILRVTAEYSDVITMLDNLSSHRRHRARSRARGVIEGDPCRCPVSRNMRSHRRHRSRRRDRELGTGWGSTPKASAGHVLKVTKKSYGVTQYVEVRPSVDFSKLEELS